MFLKKLLSKKNIFHAVLMVVGVLLVSGGFYVLLKTDSSLGLGGARMLATVLPNAPKVFPYHSELDGHGVDTPGERVPGVVAVMIDNSPDVTRQAGLAEARVVYEAPVEGGVTRYMALFNEAVSTTMVGPVRSARDYYLDWAEEYGNPLYMHVGGSPDALTRLKNVDFFDVNEFRWGSYFWRSASHAAPHNTFTNSEKWQALATTTYGRSIVKKDWSGWKFGEVSDTTNVSSTLLQLTIPYNADYKVAWEFNATSSTYERSVNQRVDKDYAGISIQANNVVVQFVSTKVVDELGRKDITTIGTGDVLVVRKGILTRGVWKKESKTVRTKFYDKLGNEIVFTPGITWVQVVPKGTVLELTN